MAVGSEPTDRSDRPKGPTVRHTRRLLTAVAGVAALATLGACGDDSATPTTAPPTSAAPSATAGVELSAEFCNELGRETPTSQFVESAPEQLQEGAAAVVAFAEALSSEEGNPDIVTELADTLGAAGIADQIDQLATAAAEQCEQSEGVEVLPQIATAATFAGGEADGPYCDALRTEFADPSAEPTIDPLVDLAPAEQRAALEELASSAGSGSSSASLGTLLGLGLYAEARCNIDGAFGMMFLASAFSGEAAGSGSGDSGESTAGNRPDPADATPANAAIPEGVDLSFTTREAPLTEEPDQYLVSAVVPADWRSDQASGLSVTGGSGTPQFGIFDQMTFRATCDGSCEPKDWEAELGDITERFQGYTNVQEGPVEGSDGRVITLDAPTGGVTGVVQRWDDTAARYFECTVELDSDNASLLPAFLTACEASRPGWIPVS